MIKTTGDQPMDQPTMRKLENVLISQILAVYQCHESHRRCAGKAVAGQQPFTRLLEVLNALLFPENASTC